MLVLSRKIGQRILIGDDIVITVVRVSGDKCRIGIDAPKVVPIVREELVLAAQLTAGTESEKETDVSSEVPTS